MFKLVSNYKQSGDQSQAIEELTKGIKEGKKEQVLLDTTGKTFKIANVIEKVNNRLWYLFIIRLPLEHYIPN